MPEPATSGNRSETPKANDTINNMFARAKYKRVRFEAKANPTDTNDVVLEIGRAHV